MVDCGRRSPGGWIRQSHDIALVNRLRNEESVDGVILGGTELPLLLPTPSIAGIPALDTTALHVAAIVKCLRQGGVMPSPAQAPAT